MTIEGGEADLQGPHRCARFAPMKRLGTGIMVGAVLLVMGVSVGGCGPSSRDLCGTVQSEIRNLFFECGIPINYTIVFAGTTDPACPSVNRVERREEIVNECLPWLAAVTCEEIDPFNPIGSIPPFCSADHFVVVR